MSTCVKDLFDYDLVKKCSKCGIISLKSNFHKNNTRNDGLYNQCKVCRKDYYNENLDRLLSKQKFYTKENRDQIKEYQKNYYLDNRDQIIENHKNYIKQNREKIRLYEKNRKKTDLNFKIACNLRSRTSSAFKSQNVRKTNKTFDLLGCSHSFFKNWIVYQLYGNMTLENYGSIWQIDHCIPTASFNLLDERDMKKCFNWINLRPMYSNENNSKNIKIDNRLYLLQEMKTKYFLKLNEERYNEDLY